MALCRRCPAVPLLVALAATALVLPAATAVDSPSPDFSGGDSPSPDSWAAGSPSPSLDGNWMGDGSPSPSPVGESSPSPSPGGPAGGWMSSESPSPDPFASPDAFASPSPSPSPSPGAEDPWAIPASPDPYTEWAGSPSPAMSPEVSAPPPAPLASPPSPPPPSPPPPPVGWADRITLFLDGAASPLPSDQTAALADSLSALTPGYTWQFMLQQPAYEAQQPEVPAMEATLSPAPAPASSAAADAAAPAPAPAVGALLAPAPGPSPASLEAADLAQRVSVDPLPQNNLGGRRRLRQAGSPPAAATSDASAAGASGELPFAIKDQCYSVKHVLAPDEGACMAYCDSQVAAGKVDAAELKPRFYDCRAVGACPTGSSCCRCTSSKKPSPPPAGTPASPAGPAPPTDGATPSSTPAASSPTPDASATPATPGVAVPASPSAPAPPPAQAARPIGVFYFASTTVYHRGAEVALNRTLSKAASSGALLSSLQGVTGQSLGAVDILYLGSGKWEFAPVPQRYHRGLDSGSDTGSTPTEAASTGTNNGTIIGIALGAGCAVAVLLAIVTVVVVRRRRMKKMDGRAVVRRWESERRQADEHRLRQAEERRAASQRATERALSKSRRGSDGSAASPPLSLNATSYQPRLPNLERLRDALGLRKDHLAVAAAKVDAAEVAGAAGGAGPPAAPAAAAAPATSPARGSATRGAEPKRSFTTFGGEGRRPGSGDTAGSEAPLTSVVVRPQGGLPPAAAPATAPAGPSWSSRDPGHVASKSSGMFGGFFSKKA